MLKLKLQEFEFIRNNTENIFFVAHRHIQTFRSKKATPRGWLFPYFKCIYSVKTVPSALNW